MSGAYVLVSEPFSNRNEHSRSRPLRVLVTPIISHALDAGDQKIMTGNLAVFSRAALAGPIALGLAGTALAQEKTPDDPRLFAPGQLTVATSDPVFPPWMMDNDPSNGEGFESA